ncbi:MAG: epoxyqueuosine reductase QueH [Lactobacillales bacterium]|nr:epoxyqueuosine reductase QueH [Lactobacillales bacterium]
MYVKLLLSKTIHFVIMFQMNREKKLLLLSCCAPCSVGVIHLLHLQGTKFTVVFYNPNIKPLAEYEKRRDENKRICEKLGIPFIELEYTPEVWEKAAKGLENEPERGKRCDICFLIRLKRVAKYAKENGFTDFTSVLGISRYKDFDQVCRAAEKISREEGISYDMTNWRKNGGEEMRARLVKENDIYVQKYCGCCPKKDPKLNGPSESPDKKVT